MISSRSFSLSRVFTQKMRSYCFYENSQVSSKACIFWQLTKWCSQSHCTPGLLGLITTFSLYQLPILSLYLISTSNGSVSLPLKLMQKFTGSFFKTQGALAGFGTMLSTLVLLQSKERLLMTGLSVFSRRVMIFCSGFCSISSIMMQCPFPFYAQPRRSSSEHPFPMPMEWMRVCCVCLEMYRKTSVTLLTAPSVRKKSCLGQPLITCLLIRFWMALRISVPPKSACMRLICFTAYSILFFQFLALSWKRYLYLLPKLNTLKQLSSGRLLRKIYRALLALSILIPPMEPLRSRRKMYSPLVASRLTQKFFCLSASSMDRGQYLGMNEMAAVVLLSEFERQQEGFSKSSITQERVKSLLGNQLGLSKVAFIMLLLVTTLILCDSEKTLRIFLEEWIFTFTFQTHFPSIFILPGKDPNASSCACLLLAQRGVMAVVSLYWQKVLQSREFKCRQTRVTFTVDLPVMLPTTIFIMSLLKGLNSPRAAPPPSFTCLSYSLRAYSFSRTSPWLRWLPNSTSNLMTVELGQTGNTYCTSRGWLFGLTQICVRVTWEWESTMSISQLKALRGSSRGGP